MSISDNCTISLHFVTGFCCQAGQGQTQQADARHRLVVLLSITGTHYPHTFSSLLHAHITHIHSPLYHRHTLPTFILLSITRMHYICTYCQVGQEQAQQTDTSHRLVAFLSITRIRYPHSFSSLLHAHITFCGLLTGFWGQSGNVSLII